LNHFLSKYGLHMYLLHLLVSTLSAIYLLCTTVDWANEKDVIF